jgi:hypothetical protein
MVEKGSLFSMFSTIRMCVGLKLSFFQANGIFGFGGLNLFSELSGVHILAYYLCTLFLHHFDQMGIYSLR